MELRFGDQRAVVVEVGGGLREYDVAGHVLLDGYAEDQRCRSGRGQILAPWPNRLKDGSYEWEAQSLQLALSEAARSNAIHGLLRFVNWTVAQHSDNSVTMSYLLHPQDGYPFTLALQATYALDHQGLSVRTRATNLGGQACPYGIGAHPYLTVGTDTIDECLLQSPARRWMPSDERGIPTGEIVASAGGEYDFAVPRPIGDIRMDTCFCDLRRDADGCARVRLQTPDGRRAVTLWMDERHSFLMLFTGDTLAQPDCRRAIAVEPMTCAPNAFRSGLGLVALEPGQSFACAWGIQPI